MFLIVYVCRTRIGMDDKVAMLYEEWQRNVCLKTPGYLSGELLVNIHDPREFIAITRFASEDAVWALTQDPEHSAWYSRLVRLAESGPVVTHYRCVQPAN